MSNLPEDLAVLFLQVGDEISQNDYAAIPITIEGEDVPLFDELVKRDLLDCRDTTGFLGSAATVYNATKFTYEGKRLYETMKREQGA